MTVVDAEALKFDLKMKGHSHIGRNGEQAEVQRLLVKT
jgi:hypothetical protein